MITATIATRKKVHGVASLQREIKHWTSTEEARRFLKPIATDMAICKQLKKEPKVEIMGVSWDLESEKRMLLEIKAFISTENEQPDN